jgi:uncharacterized protein YgbK (DUF1537 family)
LDSPSICAIADDLTGALETGSKFAAMSLGTRVSTKLVPRPEGISVFDTETRHLSGPDAASRIATLARGIRHDLIYKKTDSTLRGNIGAELGALAKVFPDRRIVFVPAYPALGRIVRNGELLVDGIPVHETPIGQDKLNPLRSSSIQACLGDVDATVIDGETDADILAAARQIVEDKRPVIVAGPAAIAGALAAQYSQVPAQLAMPSQMRCLVINGSLHPASADQMSNHRFEENWFRFEYTGTEVGLELARRLGAQVKALLTESQFEAMIIFGGDTAYGIHQALGAVDFDSCGEILPGVPVSKSQGMYWITKAGGFGKADLLQRLKEKL